MYYYTSDDDETTTAVSYEALWPILVINYPIIMKVSPHAFELSCKKASQRSHQGTLVLYVAYVYATVALGWKPECG